MLSCFWNYPSSEGKCFTCPVQLNADTAGIVIKSRATSDSIWRQPGAIVWTKLICTVPEPFDTLVTGLVQLRVHQEQNLFMQQLGTVFFLANIYGESESKLGKKQKKSGKRALTSVRPSQSDRFPLLCRPSIHYERPTNSQLTKWLIRTNSFSESICHEYQDISLRSHLFPPVDWFALNEKWFLFPAQPSSWMIHIWQSKLRV